MNKCLIALLLLISAAQSFSQEILTPREKALKNAHRKAVAGTIFLSSGAVVATGGAILIATAPANNHDTYVSTGELQRVFGVFFIAVGTGLMATSIPFYIGANNARNRANASVSFKGEKFDQLRGTRFSTGYYPAVSIRIPLTGR